jgi:hypothetical protein
VLGVLLLVRLGPGLITALQNRVVEIGRVRLARVKCDDDPLMTEINFHTLYAFDFPERPAQLSHAFVAIFALGCDLDRFQDRVIGSFRTKRIAWVGIVGSGRVHRFFI